MKESPRPNRRFSRWKTTKRTFVLGGASTKPVETAAENQITESKQPSNVPDQRRETAVRPGNDAAPRPSSSQTKPKHVRRLKLETSLASNPKKSDKTVSACDKEINPQTDAENHNVPDKSTKDDKHDKSVSKLRPKASVTSELLLQNGAREVVAVENGNISSSRSKTSEVNQTASQNIDHTDQRNKLVPRLRSKTSVTSALRLGNGSFENEPQQKILDSSSESSSIPQTASAKRKDYNSPNKHVVSEISSKTNLASQQAIRSSPRKKTSSENGAVEQDKDKNMVEDKNYHQTDLRRSPRKNLTLKTGELAQETHNHADTQQDLHKDKRLAEENTNLRRSPRKNVSLQNGDAVQEIHKHGDTQLNSQQSSQKDSTSQNGQDAQTHEQGMTQMSQQALPKNATSKMSQEAPRMQKNTDSRPKSRIPSRKASISVNSVSGSSVPQLKLSQRQSKKLVAGDVIEEVKNKNSEQKENVSLESGDKLKSPHAHNSSTNTSHSRSLRDRSLLASHETMQKQRQYPTAFFTSQKKNDSMNKSRASKVNNSVKSKQSQTSAHSDSSSKTSHKDKTSSQDKTSSKMDKSDTKSAPQSLGASPFKDKTNKIDKTSNTSQTKAKTSGLKQSKSSGNKLSMSQNKTLSKSQNRRTLSKSTSDQSQLTPPEIDQQQREHSSHTPDLTSPNLPEISEPHTSSNNLSLNNKKVGKTLSKDRSKVSKSVKNDASKRKQESVSLKTSKKSPNRLSTSLNSSVNRSLRDRSLLASHESMQQQNQYPIHFFMSKTKADILNASLSSKSKNKSKSQLDADSRKTTKSLQLSSTSNSSNKDLSKDKNNERKYLSKKSSKTDINNTGVKSSSSIHKTARLKLSTSREKVGLSPTSKQSKKSLHTRTEGDRLPRVPQSLLRQRVERCEESSLSQSHAADTSVFQDDPPQQLWEIQTSSRASAAPRPGPSTSGGRASMDDTVRSRGRPPKKRKLTETLSQAETQHKVRRTSQHLEDQKIQLWSRDGQKRLASSVTPYDVLLHHTSNLMQELGESTEDELTQRLVKKIYVDMKRNIKSMISQDLHLHALEAEVREKRKRCKKLAEDITEKNSTITRLRKEADATESSPRDKINQWIMNYRELVEVCLNSAAN